MRRIFRAMAETPVPEVKAVLQGDFRDPNLKGLAKQAVTQIERQIQETVTVAAGDTLPASKATLTGDIQNGAIYSQYAEAILSWLSPDTWFIWHFKVKEAGNYGFSVLQSYLEESPSQYEIIVGERTFSGSSQRTGSAEEFTTVSLDGSIALEPGKIHTLILHGHGITQPRMMDIKGIRVEKR
jgi:hypothetical protein